MNEETHNLKSITFRIKPSLRMRLVNAGIPPERHTALVADLLHGRARNEERKAGRETESLHLAGMPEGMGDALAALVERRGLGSVSELAEDLFRAALATEGVALPGEGPRGDAPASEVRSPPSGLPTLTLN